MAFYPHLLAYGDVANMGALGSNPKNDDNLVSVASQPEASDSREFPERVWSEPAARSKNHTPVHFFPMHQRCFSPRWKMSPSENAGDA